MVPPAIRPDPGPAQELLRRELARAAYRPTPAEQVQRWLSELLDRAGNAAGRLADLGLPAVLLVLVLLLAVVALVLSRLRRNPLAPREPTGVFDDVRRSAAEHRRLADAAFTAADFDTAVIEAVRALAAGLVERGIASDDPTVTAREVTTLAAARFAELTGPLSEAARTFDVTRYGGRPADRAGAAACLELESTVRTSEPSGNGGPVLAVPR